MKIDDPVDAAPVHGFCGIWGVLACGLFDWGKGFEAWQWEVTSPVQGDGEILIGVKDDDSMIKDGEIHEMGIEAGNDAQKGLFIHPGEILGYVVEFTMGICPSTIQEVEG